VGVTQQSLILIATLITMAGLAVGYALGVLAARAKPYEDFALGLIGFLLDVRGLEKQAQEVRVALWACTWDMEQRTWR
jgi:hypothetical protein